MPTTLLNLDLPSRLDQCYRGPSDHHQYVGRFAPSPSGQLHFGSLVAAVGSYLQAKANNGLWLVRIEDIDPPREVPGSADDILHTLTVYGLDWDGSVLYQSQQSQYYLQVLSHLAANQQSYTCDCTRQRIKQHTVKEGIYNRYCRDRLAQTASSVNGPFSQQQPPVVGCAIRLKNDHPVTEFNDGLQGLITDKQDDPHPNDFIIHRKDGLFAYQLAVVVDDIMQNVTEVVRGSDLLTVTLQQMTLFKVLGYQPINYTHLPLAVTPAGLKLSKQNHAPAVSLINVQQTLYQVLQFLGLSPTAAVKNASVTNQLAWAIDHWALKNLQKAHLGREQTIDDK